MLAVETTANPYASLITIAIFFLILIIIGIVSNLTDFLQELRGINTDLKQARGAERKHLLRKRRRLWLSLLPFIKY